MPAEWPQGAAYEASTPGAAAVSEIGWREFYRDGRLRTVVELSLTNNRDLRIATLNIERARALYRIRRADQFPTIEAVASGTAQRIPGSISPTGDGSTYRDYRVEVGFASYELDLFGRVRNLKEQALQEYLAVVETQRSAHISLVAEVAAVWVTLATDQALLKLAQNTFESRRRSFELTQRSYELGIASALDLERARTSVETARDDVAAYTRFVAQDRNALQLLVGAPVPETLLPDASVDPVTALTDLPAGVLSSVLLAAARYPRGRTPADRRTREYRRRARGVLPVDQPHGHRRHRERQPVGPVRRRQRGLDVPAANRPADLHRRQEPGATPGHRDRPRHLPRRLREGDPDRVSRSGRRARGPRHDR